MAHVTSPRPRDMPGYGEAREAGIAPSVPATPPLITVQPPAGRAMRDFWVTLAGVVGASTLAAIIGSDDGRLDVPGLLLFLTVTVAGIAVAVRKIRRVGRALLAEIRLGYATTTFQQGAFWLGRGPGRGVMERSTGWDWSGLWVLRTDGTVVSAPNSDVDPPGLYPSPNRPGSYELWTGHQWTAYHPDP